MGAKVILYGESTIREYKIVLMPALCGTGRHSENTLFQAPKKIQLSKALPSALPSGQLFSLNYLLLSSCSLYI
jgi:hypothetical protein